jgi:DNA-binding GntR family transcriptional regulator
MAQHIADVLRAAIRDGSLVDGSELNQVHLAEHFGTSRVPVREALRVLQAEGLVSAPPHRCARVAGFTRGRVVEIFELRALLEGHLLERSFPCFGETGIRDLWRLCDEMDATEDHDEWLEKNQAFHEALCAPTDAEMTKQLAAQLAQRYLQAPQVERPVVKEEAGREHRSIVRAIEQGDAQGARSALEAHIEHTKRNVLQRLDARSR